MAEEHWQHTEHQEINAYTPFLIYCRKQVILCCTLNAGNDAAEVTSVQVITACEPRYE